MKWLKEQIKDDIIGFLLLCFILGAMLVWFTGHFAPEFNLSTGEKVNATVLWLTALAIFWYAYETYQLKKSTSDQALLQEEAMLNDFLPILEPFARGGKTILGAQGLERLYLRNLGKGPAKYIELRLGKLRIPIDASIGEREDLMVKIPTRTQREIMALAGTKPTHIPFKICYQDIYGRRFKTDNCVLEGSARGNYVLRHGAWDFKRLDNNPKVY